MNEYIKREDALEITKRTSGDYATAFAEICKIPAADISPVVYGEWVRPHWKNSIFCYYCSVCGNEVMHQEYRWKGKKIYPICPWCGARIYRGENDG